MGKWSLKAKFRLIFGVVVGLNLLSAAVLLHSVQGQKADGVVINLAGAQRMLSQRMSKDALLIRQKAGDPQALKASVERFHLVLTGLIDGNRELGLPRCDDPAIRQQLTQVGQLWFPFRDSILSVAEGKATEVDYQRVIQTNVGLLTAMNKAVGMFEADAASKVWRMQVIEIISALILAGVVFYACFFIVSPLAQFLGEVVENASLGAEQVNRAAADIANVSQTMAQGTSAQAAAIEETSASTKTIASLSRSNNESAAKVAGVINDSAEKYESLSGTLKGLVNTLTESQAASDRISKIIKIIDEIAFQTNILALNAAVEAARAGETGVGFAVVADEVRTLARRCAQAAHDSTALLTQSVSLAHEGKARVDEVATAFEALAESNNTSRDLIESLRLASEEQTTGVGQITGAVQEIQDVVVKAAAVSEESAASAEELSAQAATMRATARQLTAIVNGEQ